MSSTQVDVEQQGPVGPPGIEDIDDLGELDDLEDIDGEDVALDDGLDDDDALDDDVDDGLDDDALAVDGDETPGAVAVVTDGSAKTAAPADAAVETETDDDELLADEVEASLDVILADRLRGGDNEADDDVEDDEEDDDGAPNQLATVIPVRRPEEFLCQSCFLLKPPGQLADPDHQLCRDCA